MSKNSISKYIMLLVDLFSFFISLPLTIWIIEQLKWDLYIYIPQSELEERFIIHLCLSILCVCWFWMRLRHYTYRKPFWFELKEILRTVLIFAVIELAIVGFSKLYFSRSIWVIMWPITCFTVAFFRVATKVILIKTGMYLKNTIIVGGGKNAVEAVNAIRRETYLGLCIKYIISSNSSSELQALNIPVILTKDNEVEDLITSRDDQFIIALEDEEVQLRDSWLRNLIRKKYRFISVIPTLRGLPLYSTDVSFLFSYDIMLLRINHNLAKRSSKIMKRGMDILVSFLSIILLLPLLCVIFFIILISGGKPIYGHNRVGLNGQTFKCWKFRTMKKDADNLLEQLLKNDPIANQQWQAERKLKGDPRITRFGRWMRKYSVDELPQLWNVLVGQMSLVGPRPITESELKYYNDDITYYLMAKPGMTGLWQVSGRNNVDYETRVYFDAWYVKNWSLWNDIAILFKTVNVVLKRDGAY